MTNELFEQEAAARDTEGLDSPIAPSPILDGSQALRHDGYDVQEFQHACVTFARLGELVRTSAQRLVTAPALLADLFWSFMKRAPEIAPLVPLTPAYTLNAAVLTQIMGTVEWEQVRQAGTPGDLLNSALATIGVATKALAAYAIALLPPPYLILHFLVFSPFVLRFILFRSGE